MNGRIVVLTVYIALLSSGYAEARASRVGGYTRRSTGAYVMPHHRTTPNRTRFDNYSSRPNTNPFTGKSGTRDPLAVTP
jgi:hypothetical protein